MMKEKTKKQYKNKYKKERKDVVCIIGVVRRVCESESECEGSESGGKCPEINTSIFGIHFIELRLD